MKLASVRYKDEDIVAVRLDEEHPADVRTLPGLDTVRFCDVGLTDMATACIEHLRADDIDAAVSYSMIVDHAFSQTITVMLGGLTARPVIPVFINCITKPFVPSSLSW